MSIILSKVRIPQRRRDILRRSRLIDALHENLHRKLIFISSPAGYGKTTLLIDFANDVDARVCWYRITPEDVDLRPFVGYLTEAFRQQFPGFGAEMLAVLQSPGGTLEPRGLAVEFVNELTRQVSDFCVLVLDDYHLAGETQPIVDFIESLLDYLPDQVRMVIAGRSVYGIPAASLYVRDHLATLGEEQMRFRAEEIQALVAQNYKIRLSDEQINSLAQRSDGWIIAVILALRAIEHGFLPQFEGATVQVYSFLAQEVVNLQPKWMQDFLLATSILEEFNEPLCNAILQIENAGELIQAVEGRNLFITRMESRDGAPLFRYHQLFQDYLRSRLRQNDPDGERRLHQRAAQHYWQTGERELAVQHRLAAGDREGAAAWMNEAAAQVFIAGKSILLAEWIAALGEPTDLRPLAPELLLNWGKTLIDRGEYAAGEQALALAEPVFRRRGQPDLLLSLLFNLGLAKHFQGMSQAALAIAEEMQAISREAGPGSYYASLAERLMGVAHLDQGRLEAAVRHLEQAVGGLQALSTAPENASRAAQFLHDLAEGLTDLGMAHYEHGNMLGAQDCFLQALRLRQSAVANRAALSQALNNVGYLYYQMGQYREAWLAMEQAYELALANKQNRLLLNIQNSRGDLLRDLDEWQEAERCYQDSRQRAERSERRMAYDAHLGLSELNRLTGNYQDAMFWLREAAHTRGHSLESPRYQAGLGTIYLAMRQLELARQALQQAVNAWGSLEKASQEQVLAIFWLGCCHFELGDHPAALECLQTCLAWAARLGYDQYLVAAGRRALPFLQFARKHSPAWPQLDSLLKRIQAFQPGKAQLMTPAIVYETPQVALQAFGFGNGQVKRENAAIPAAEWRSSNARALFFYLLDQAGVRKEVIALEFWPDFSPAKVSSNFHATLWRVRKALDVRDAIIFQDNKYLVNPSISVWYDVAQFEALAAQAAAPGLSAERRADLWKQAAELYQGDYLQDILMDWADQRRSELQARYLAVLQNLADWEALQRRVEEALSAYQKILAIDSYRDDVHLALMKLLAYHGRSSAAKAHFQAYRKQLQKELKTEPTVELLDFYNKLV
jgi:DNA-binding SARP family transcriptional activator/tetratricopeptide (TPR) repeat protein